MRSTIFPIAVCMVSALCLLLTFTLSACQRETPDYPEREAPKGLLDNKEQQAAGQMLFSQKCASCHGKPSEGRSVRAQFFEPPAPDFTESNYRQADPSYLFWRIEVGKTVEPYLSQGSVMPAWSPHLSSQQIWQLVAYLKSRSE